MAGEARWCRDTLRGDENVYGDRDADMAENEYVVCSHYDVINHPSWAARMYTRRYAVRALNENERLIPGTARRLDESPGPSGGNSVQYSSPTSAPPANVTVF